MKTGYCNSKKNKNILKKLLSSQLWTLPKRGFVSASYVSRARFAGMEPTAKTPHCEPTQTQPNPKDKKNFCGSLDFRTGSPVSAFKVVAGDHQFEQDDGFEQMFDAQRIEIHPQYDVGNNMENDIALIKLDGRLRYTRAVSPVCLPRRDLAAGTTCTVTGWGDTRSTGRRMRVHVWFVSCTHTGISRARDCPCGSAPAILVVLTRVLLQDRLEGVEVPLIQWQSHGHRNPNC